MKQLFLALAFLSLSLSSFSQSEVAEIFLGEIVDIDHISIEFIELISDSRCPEGVNCIRAGEAEILVAVYNNGKFSHEQKLIFYASGIVKENNMQLFASEHLFIRGLTLSPYPRGLSKVRDEDYALTIGIN